MSTLRPSRGRAHPLLVVLILGAALPLSCAPPADDDDSQQAFVPCEYEERAVPYEAGMSETGEAGLVDVALLSVTPAPPDVGASEWLVRISDADQASPLPDCSVAATGWMPDHGHGGPDGASSPSTEPGEYVISGLNFTMSGYWEITLAVECPTFEPDQVVFRFCLDG